jgi:hypothetical protein
MSWVTASAVGSLKVHNCFEIASALDDHPRETVAGMMTAAHRMTQTQDSGTRGWCYRSGVSAVILCSESGNGHAQSLFAIYEDRAASDFSTLAHGWAIGMPLNKGIVPSQQRSSITRNLYRLLGLLRCGDRRESNRAWWDRRAEHEVGYG